MLLKAKLPEPDSDPPRKKGYQFSVVVQHFGSSVNCLVLQLLFLRGFPLV